AFDKLEIPVYTRHHQQLLERLWRLGQRIELARVHTAWYHEITGTFRCRFNEYRCLNFQEMMAVEVIPGFLCKTVSKHKVVSQRVAPEVEVAVLHPQIVTAVRFVFNGKGG